jgi:type II secretory pathway pseudopilin PulG
MTALRGVPARLRRARRRGSRSSGADHGFTLVDLLVSMSLMAVLMVLFTGGIIVVYRSFTRDDELVRANLQLHQAFSRLDREIRYASGVTDPGQVNGTWYVEYQVTNTGMARCTQLRFQPTAGCCRVAPPRPARHPVHGTRWPPASAHRPARQVARADRSRCPARPRPVTCTTSC